jgi:hypothetical protein
MRGTLVKQHLTSNVSAASVPIPLSPDGLAKAYRRPARAPLPDPVSDCLAQRPAHAGATGAFGRAVSFRDRCYDRTGLERDNP